MDLYQTLAGTVLAVHLVWIIWVIVGCLLTRNRPVWRGIHIVSLIYSLLIETLLWPCPLTLVEQWLQDRAGIIAYQEDFIIHYLEAVIYPDVSQSLLMGSVWIVCLFNLGVYGLRFHRRRAARW